MGTPPRRRKNRHSPNNPTRRRRNRGILRYDIRRWVWWKVVSKSNPRILAHPNAQRTQHREPRKRANQERQKSGRPGNKNTKFKRRPPSRPNNRERRGGSGG